MPEVPTGLGPSTSHDRLSALRQNSQSPVSAVTPRKIRIELLVGAAAFLAVIAVLFVLLGSRVQQTSSVTTVPVAKSPVEGELQSGQALIPLALEEGSFPPHVEVGDQVRIIVSPSSDGTGTTRRLEEETIVQSMSGPSDIGGRSVMTVRGPESVAVAISASGPIHVAIVHEAKP
jgi:hypothetical protein